MSFSAHQGAVVAVDQDRGGVLVEPLLLVDLLAGVAAGAGIELRVAVAVTQGAERFGVVEDETEERLRRLLAHRAGAAADGLLRNEMRRRVDGRFVAEQLA